MSPGSFRLFLAWIVVVHHSFPLRMGNWAVGMFFILSGYWISKMWRKKYSNQPRPYRTFVISRWWRLAPLFVCVQLMGAALVLAGFDVGDPTAISNGWWWVTQPLIIGSTQFARLLPPSWSLNVEMQFYLIAPVLIAWIIGWPRTAFGILLSGLFVWSALRLFMGATLEEPYVDVFLWLFLTGVACDRFDFRPSKNQSIASASVVCGLVLLVLIFPQTRELIWKRGSDGVTEAFLPEALFLVTAVIGIPAAIYTVHQKSGSFDRWLGDLSYPLYLFHWFSRDWYYSVVDWSRPPIHNGLLLICNFLFALIGAIILLHLVDRPAQRGREAWLEYRARRNESKAFSSAVPNRA